MKTNTVRGVLLLLFVVPMAVELACIFHVSDGLWPKELNHAVKCILGVYSPQLGVMLTGFFIDRHPGKGKTPVAFAWTAFGLALLWNGIVAWRFVELPYVKDDINDVLEYLETVSAAGSILVAAGLAYYFGHASSHAET